MARPRVGILSMQRIANYGSFLQAWGLKSLLEGLGADVQFVDYEPGPCLEGPRGARKTGLARKLSKAAEALSYDAPMRDKLAFVRHKRSYGPRFYPLLGLTDAPNLDPELDLLVIGSDEVFNCVQANPNVGYAPALFGQGIRAKRKVSYAASFGNTTLERLERHGKSAEVGGWLAALDALSVRDKNSAGIVRALTGSEPEPHLDPVLAYDFLGKCPRIPAEVDERMPYMVLYGYSGRLSREECAAARAYADGAGLRVLNIGGVQGCCDRFVDCSPFEVIAYFARAEAVVTDTFHGTILAAITERPFATIVRESGYGNAQKLGDLLGRLGLEGRSTDAAGVAATLTTPVDWAPARDAVADGRVRARDYLACQLDLCEGR